MKKHGNSKFKVSRLKLNRGYIRSIIKNPNKMRVRVYKTNKILKFKGRPNLKVDTITEVRLTLDEARRCGLLRYESEEDDDNSHKYRKIKLFSEHKNLKPFKIPDDWKGKFTEMVVQFIDHEKLFNDEMPLLDETEKARVRKFKKEIKKNPEFLFVDGELSDENTHSLNQFSNDDVQVWSKDISLCNRFVYDVARPELNETQRLVLWKVGIRNLHDHKYKGKRYSDTRTYVLKRILK